MDLIINLFNHYKRSILAFDALVFLAFHIWVIHYWFGFELTLALYDGLVSNLFIAIFCIAVIGIIVHYVPNIGKFWFSGILSFIFAWICLWSVNEILLSIGQDDEAYISFVKMSSPIRFGIDLLVITFISVGSLYYQQLLDSESKAKRQEVTGTMVKEAELQKLQLQLQPHFLFNSLNSINALILTKQKEARDMVQSLSNFLRTTIKRADEHWISLHDEWIYLQLYLDIEKVRFGHRLTVNADFDPLSLSWEIPTLLLQPLVENAIKFGLYGTTGPVTISCQTKIDNNLLLIMLTNPFDADTKPGGSGFGLAGLKRRLYLLYARNDLLNTHIQDNLFTVTLKLPKHHDQNHTH